MKLMQCSGLPEIYGQLEEGGWGQSVMKLMQCNGLPEIYVQLWGVHLPNMSTLRNLLLLHRGLFYKRPNRMDKATISDQISQTLLVK